MVYKGTCIVLLFFSSPSMSLVTLSEPRTDQTPSEAPMSTSSLERRVCSLITCCGLWWHVSSVGWQKLRRTKKSQDTGVGSAASIEDIRAIKTAAKI